MRAVDWPVRVRVLGVPVPLCSCMHHGGSSHIHPPIPLTQVGAYLQATLASRPDWRFLLDANQASLALASLLPSEVRILVFLLRC